MIRARLGDAAAVALIAPGQSIPVSTFSGSLAVLAGTLYPSHAYLTFEQYQAISHLNNSLALAGIENVTADQIHEYLAAQPAQAIPFQTALINASTAAPRSTITQSSATGALIPIHAPAPAETAAPNHHALIYAAAGIAAALFLFSRNGARHRS